MICAWLCDGHLAAHTSCSEILKLAWASLQMSAYLIGEGHDEIARVKRLNRFVGALPTAWFKPGAPQGARSLLDGAKRLSVHFASRSKSRTRLSAELTNFASVLTKLGLVEQAATLAKTL